MNGALVRIACVCVFVQYYRLQTRALVSFENDFYCYSLSLSLYVALPPSKHAPHSIFYRQTMRVSSTTSLFNDVVEKKKKGKKTRKFRSFSFFSATTQTKNKKKRIKNICIIYGFHLRAMKENIATYSTRFSYSLLCVSLSFSLLCSHSNSAYNRINGIKKMSTLNCEM